MDKSRVAIIGSGNWGSAIAKIVGENVKKFPHFERDVRMYVYEEMIGDRKLTEIINTEHENVKYLKGHKLPENIIADPNQETAAKDADILIFVIPHAFLENTCKPIIGKVKSSAVGISLIKGFGMTKDGDIELVSHVIKRVLGINAGVLMGANLANEVADEKFCETTIGCKDVATGRILKDLFQTDNFRVTVVPDCNTVEICGALKNIVACAAGFSDGLDYGLNTKSAIIRIGFAEMITFCKKYYSDGMQTTTFFESCGVADLITTCFGGRNRKVSEAFVKTGKSIDVLEAEMLNGQKLQGIQTAEEVYSKIKSNGHENIFPLFVTVHLIATKKIPPQEMIRRLRI